jgi:hypothetical protein
MFDPMFVICPQLITDPEKMDEFEDWHFGFFLHQQWTRQQGEKIMAELVEVKQSFKS